MTAGCARCGDCCDPVHFDTAALEHLARYTTAEMENTPDPAGDGWASWKDSGWTDDLRDEAIRRYRADGEYRENADFITLHWTPADEKTCRCDMFDPGTRLCTAHDTRPPVCRDYPWYGREPDADFEYSPRCSYLADLAPGRRPEGARPLIPLAILQRGAR